MVCVRESCVYRREGRREGGSVCVYDIQYHLPPWQQNILSSMMAAMGRQLKQSVNVFHSLILYRRLPTTTTYIHVLYVHEMYMSMATLMLERQTQIHVCNIRLDMNIWAFVYTHIWTHKPSVYSESAPFFSPSIETKHSVCYRKVVFSLGLEPVTNILGDCLTQVFRSGSILHRP